MTKEVRKINEKIGLRKRLEHAWNVFKIKEPEHHPYFGYGPAYPRRPDIARLGRGKNRSIVASIYNRLAIDVASNKIHHVDVDEEGNFLEVRKSLLNEVLCESANIDQTGTDLVRDISMSLFDEGVVAVVPVDTTIDPTKSGSFEIETLRTAKILQFMPRHVRVEIYDDQAGIMREIVVEKETTAIIENPLYATMNEYNSTLQRLYRKLNLLDVIDEAAASGKLDLIIQLPYQIKTELRKQQANERLNSIVEQLTESELGIAYTDGTEKITQLNRPVENNLQSQVEYLTTMAYNQLGLTESVLDGTADEATMLNYYNRTIAPILNAIVEEMRRKFLTKTARTQKQSIMWLSKPFQLVPAAKLAEIADKFTRNEIMSSNEFRSIVGLQPSSEPSADELRNKNLNQSTDVTENINVEKEEDTDE